MRWRFAPKSPRQTTLRMDETAALHARIAALEKENAALREAAEAAAAEAAEAASPASRWSTAHALSRGDVARYSRHLLMPAIGVKGQEALRAARVLVVGAGGLGSPVLLYLAAAGVGTLGIVDDDEVDESNLQRQVVHTEARTGMNKAVSAAEAVRALNGGVQVDIHQTRVTRENAMALVRAYDVVVDAVDNAPTRYCVSDACVLAKRPLVSASCIQMEGQATVYNHADGPCYRCLFPTPPPIATVTNCSDGGVLGVIPGLLGCIQALEVVKIIVGMRAADLLVSKMLLVDGHGPLFRTIKLRGRSAACIACGDNPQLDENALPDYAAFCGMPSSDDSAAVACVIEAAHKPLEPELQIAPEALASRMAKNSDFTLLDVRSPVQYDICALDGSVNVPLADLERAARKDEQHAVINEAVARGDDILVLCRRGIDSTTAVRLLTSRGVASRNITGGLEAYAAQVDPTLPLY